MSENTVEIGEAIDIEVVLDEDGRPIGAIVDDLIVATSADGTVVEEIIDVLDADGNVVLEDEIVSVYDENGQLIESEETIRAVD